MPLYKVINHNPTTTILVWKIEESFEDLFDEIVLNDLNFIRLNNMRSELHQRGFLSVRKLLQEVGLSDFDLYYTPEGKPKLKDERNISISHSYEFSAIAISDNAIGIDLEKNREKVKRIADKFCEYELNYLDHNNDQEYIEKLTIIWGAKESIFKIKNKNGISFKNHIKVNPFNLDEKQGRTIFHMEDSIEDYKIHFENIENYSLVYAIPN